MDARKRTELSVYHISLDSRYIFQQREKIITRTIIKETSFFTVFPSIG